MYIVGKYNIYLYEFEIFCLISHWVQMNFIFSVNVRILYLFCNVKKSKTTAKLSKRAESSFVLFVFDGVICEISTYTITVSYCRSTWIRYQKNNILVSDRINQKFIQSMKFDCSIKTNAG